MEEETSTSACNDVGTHRHLFRSRKETTERLHFRSSREFRRCGQSRSRRSFRRSRLNLLVRDRDGVTVNKVCEKSPDRGAESCVGERLRDMESMEFRGCEAQCTLVFKVGGRL